MSLKSKSNWIIPEQANVDTLIEQLLKKRNIENEEQFLNPKLEDIPDYTHLYDSTKAAKEIIQSIHEDKKIIIHGDFDADGISSVSILWQFLYKEVAQHLNKKVDVLPYIPNRIDQGYGLSQSSIEDMLELNAQTIITVDCGIRDKELIQQHQEKLHFIITDHHQPPEDILDNLTYTVVHPMFPKQEYPQQEICGAYVTLLLTQAIRAELGIESQINEQTPGLDLTGLATVTDLMPLKSFNRTIVKYALEQMKQKTRPGLVELSTISQVDIPNTDSYHLGFVLGPRVNAAGRIGNPLNAVKLMVSENTQICKNIANELNETNFQRQHLTQRTLEEAEDLIEDPEDKIIFVVGEGWHEGIVGLVAGKLNEKYHKPVLVATNNNGEIRGSARSITGFNVTQTLEECKEYLEKFGGHEQAAGFSVTPDKLEEFKKKLRDIGNKEITDEMLIKNINIDILLSTDDLTLAVINKIDRLKPFGYKNPKPTISLTNLVIIKKQIMGKLGNHLKLTCKGNGIELVQLVLFGCDQDTEELQLDQVIDVIGNLSINSWNGNETIQFQVKEWRYSNSSPQSV